MTTSRTERTEQAMCLSGRQARLDVVKPLADQEGETSIPQGSSLSVPAREDLRPHVVEV